MSSSYDNENLVENVGYTTEAINQILVYAGCPNKFRQYIDCLIGVANKNFEFETSDLEVAKRAKGRTNAAKKHADKEWARDKRRELLKWQDEGNLKLIEYEMGQYDKKARKRFPSIYKFHLLKYAEQVVNESKTNYSLLWGINPSLAIKEAAQDFVSGESARQVNLPKNEEYIDPPSEVISKLKTARTFLQQALGLLENYDFQLIDDDEKLVKEIEDLTTSIRDRGFVDKWDRVIFSNIKKNKK